MTRIDLILVHGETFRARLTVKKYGATADLTGFTVVLMIKHDAYVPDDDAANLALLADEGLTIDAVNGIVDFELTDEQAAALSTAFPYFLRLAIQDPDGVVFTPAGGDLLFQTGIPGPVALVPMSPPTVTPLSVYTAVLSTSIPSNATTDNDAQAITDNDGTPVTDNS